MCCNKSDVLQPTDIFLPSGKQYLFHRDQSGRLMSVESMVLGRHQFRTLLTVGRLRYFYTAPGFVSPYISDYGTSGELLQIIFPGEQRRVIFRYSHDVQVCFFSNVHTFFNYNTFMMNT